MCFPLNPANLLPANNGGAAITSYIATSSPGNLFSGGNAPCKSIAVTRLTNGTSYTFKVKATNALGTSNQTAASNSVIPSAPPTVSLTSPANGATAPAPASLTLTATATASGSTVTKVEYYANDTMVGSATASPYTYQWNNVLPGTHSLIALVTNALGKTAISPAVNVTVTATTLQTYYIHTDHLDTPRQITDTSGNIVWDWANLDPYGNNPPNENPSGQGTFTCNLRYYGQYFDIETGLLYNINRHYDPAIGRYVESDPIGLEGGINTYTYANQNPLSFNDPLGLATYMCTRSLSHVPFKIGPLFHQYICVPDGKGGQTCGGLGPTGNMFDSPGTIEYEKSSSKSSCEKAADDNACIEKCIQDEFKKSPPNYSVDLSHGENCQTWASNKVTSCQAQCKGKK